MKLCYLANIRYPSERAHSAQITHMCESFSKVGFDVNLVVSTRKNHSIEDLEEYYGANVDFTVTRIKTSTFNSNIKTSFFISDIVFTFKFLLKEQSRNCDVIFSRSEWSLYFLSFFFPSKKLIWEAHEKRDNYAARSILGQGVKTVVTAFGIREDIIELAKSAEQILVASNGIDGTFFRQTENRFEARNRLGLEQQEKIVMYIGGLDEWKGVQTFFKACQQCQEFTWVVIGGGVKEVNEFQGHYQAVRFLGQKPYSELRHNQRAADILVVPNTAKNELSSRYTSPLKLFAHCASGVPIVASAIESIQSILNEEEIVFFEPDNPDALCHAVKEVFAHYDYFSNRAEQLQKKARKFTWTERAKMITEFISP